jgi:hypothetical protein
VWFFCSHPGLSAPTGDTFLLGPTKRELDSQIKAKRLSGVLMLCASEAGDAIAVATTLRLYPPDLGVPSPDVISTLEASAQRVIRFEEGMPV